MAQVLLPRRRQSQLDAIGKALGLVSNVYGIAVNQEKLDAFRAQQERQATVREEEELLGVDPTSQKLAQQERAKAQAERAQQQFEQQQELRGEQIAGLKAKREQIGKPFLETPKGQEFKAKETFKAEVAASVKKAAEEKPKKLTQAMIKNIDEGRVLPGLLSNLDQVIKDNEDIMGPIEGKARALNPYDTRAKTFDAEMRAKAQAFGRFMEGGVLRAEDEAKYKRMFPELGETPEVAKNKLAIVKDLLAQKQNSLVQAFRDQGFDIRGFEEIPRNLKRPKKDAGLIREAVAGPRAPENLEQLSDEQLDAILLGR